MTKKDYIIIAKSLAKTYCNGDVDGIWNIIDDLSTAFTIDNPRFDEYKFRSFIQAECLKNGESLPNYLEN